MRILNYQTMATSVVMLLSLTSSQMAGIIFEDDFSTRPQSNGWDQIITGTGSALGEIALSQSGEQVWFDKTGGTGTIQFSISRIVPTIGFQDITLNLTAFQSNTGFESSDFLEIEYNPGTGFVSLLKDLEVWKGENDLAGEAVNGIDGQTSAVSTGDLILPPITSDNALLQIRINGSVNANAEDYVLDHITVNGTATAIPEPSAMLFFGILSCYGIGKMLTRRIFGSKETI